MSMNAEQAPTNAEVHNASTLEEDTAVHVLRDTNWIDKEWRVMVRRSKEIRSLRSRQCIISILR